MGCMMYRFIFVYVSFRYRFTFSLSYSLLNLSKPPNEICQQNYSNASTQKIRECMGELEAFGSYKNIRGANQSHPQRWYQANKEGVFVRSHGNNSSSTASRSPYSLFAKLGFRFQMVKDLLIACTR